MHRYCTLDLWGDFQNWEQERLYYGLYRLDDIHSGSASTITNNGLVFEDKIGQRKWFRWKGLAAKAYILVDQYT